MGSDGSIQLHVVAMVEILHYVTSCVCVSNGLVLVAMEQIHYGTRLVLVAMEQICYVTSCVCVNNGLVLVAMEQIHYTTRYCSFYLRQNIWN